MERFYEAVYGSFTGWSLVITMVLTAYTSYLLWNSVFRGDNAMPVSKRLREGVGFRVRGAKSGVKKRINKFFIRPFSKAPSEEELVNVLDADLDEEDIALDVKLKNGKIIRVEIDDIPDFLRNNRDQILFDNTEPEEPKLPRRSKLADWEFIDC